MRIQSTPMSVARTRYFELERELKRSVQDRSTRAQAERTHYLGAAFDAPRSPSSTPLLELEQQKAQEPIVHDLIEISLDGHRRSAQAAPRRA